MRQVLSKYANQAYLDALVAYQLKDARNLDLHSRKFVQLIKDIDKLLASDDNFLLGTWLESAKALASNPTDLRQARPRSYAFYSYIQCSDTLSHLYLELEFSNAILRLESDICSLCCSSMSGMRGHR